MPILNNKNFLEFNWIKLDWIEFNWRFNWIERLHFLFRMNWEIFRWGTEKNSYNNKKNSYKTHILFLNWNKGIEMCFLNIINAFGLKRILMWIHILKIWFYFSPFQSILVYWIEIYFRIIIVSIEEKDILSSIKNSQNWN